MTLASFLGLGGPTNAFGFASEAEGVLAPGSGFVLDAGFTPVAGFAPAAGFAPGPGFTPVAGFASAAGFAPAGLLLVAGIPGCFFAEMEGATGAGDRCAFATLSGAAQHANVTTEARRVDLVERNAANFTEDLESAALEGSLEQTNGGRLRLRFYRNVSSSRTS